MREIRSVVLFFLTVSFLTCCIPRQRVMYLQNENELTYKKQDELTLANKSKYKLKVGDILSIKMISITPDKYDLGEFDKTSTEDPILSGYVINTEGDIDVPFIGKVNVVDLTLEETRLKIKERAKKALFYPQISVHMLNYTYTILGEVNAPGTFSSYKDHISVFEAIGQAGDLTDFADRSFVKLIRMDGPVANISYLNLLEDEFLTSSSFYLEPGDMIYVPPLKVKNFTKYQLPTLALGVSAITVLSLLLVRIN